jgi:hypothetical protein
MKQNMKPDGKGKFASRLTLCSHSITGGRLEGGGGQKLMFNTALKFMQRATGGKWS